FQRGDVLQDASHPLGGSDGQYPHFARLHVLSDGGGIGGDGVGISAQQRRDGFAASVIGDVFQFFRIDPRFVSGQNGDQMVHGAGSGASRQRDALRILFQIIDEGPNVPVFGTLLHHDGTVVPGQLGQRRRVPETVGTVAFLFQVVDQKGRGVDKQLVGIVLVRGRVFRQKDRPAAPGSVFHGDRLLHQLGFGQHLGEGAGGQIPASSGAGGGHHRDRLLRISGASAFFGEGIPSRAAGGEDQGENARQQSRTEDFSSHFHPSLLKTLSPKGNSDPPPESPSQALCSPFWS